MHPGNIQYNPITILIIVDNKSTERNEVTASCVSFLFIDHFYDLSQWLPHDI